ncbi:hypothetical protein MNV49_006940 [Pseudohyphozyma bogoriensis]|nr:hypothetical protein MNV49_006940 [Pseudohyphozyma bogoriensis]
MTHGCISPTPPRVPSPRYSGDAAQFTTPPETPTRKRTNTTEELPPVPDLPLDFRTSPTVARTRSRSSSKSTGSAKSLPNKSAKPLPSCLKGSKSVVEVEELPSQVAARERARKLQKRRATIDGVFTEGGGNVHALLFQEQLKHSGDKETSYPAEKADPFDLGRDSTVLEVKNPDRPASPPRPAATRKTSAAKLKKPRPVTMPDLPPAIIVSDHPQQLVPPPTPAKARSAAVDVDAPDPRASIKTFDTVPWLPSSSSTTSAFTNNLPRDDCSILDPDMRSPRRASVDTTRFSTDTSATSVAARLSTDAETIRRIINSPFASPEIYSKAGDDDRSVTSAENNTDLDTEDEQMLRTQRRRTLLYSVYQQRGLTNIPIPEENESTPIPLTPSSASRAPSPTAPAPPLPSTPTPPPRPAKSTSRQSAMINEEAQKTPPSPSPPSTATLLSRIPIPNRSPIAIAVTSSPSPTPQPRSFAADLQASVGLPPSGYDSDTLLSYSPGRTTYSGLSSMYSTSAGSIESLEEAAISRAETVKVGARASGIPQLTKRSTLGFQSTEMSSSAYDSDESTYDESDGDVGVWSPGMQLFTMPEAK